MTRTHRRASSPWVMMVAGLLVSGFPAVGAAQTHVTIGRLPGGSANAPRLPAIELLQSLVTLDDSTPTETITFVNPWDHATEIWIKPFYSTMKSIPVYGGHPIMIASVEDAGGSALDSAWLTTFTSAVPWLSDFPNHVVFQPHERREISVRVLPDPTLPAGEYLARFEIMQSPVPDAAGQLAMPHTDLLVVYHRKASGAPSSGPHPTRRLAPATVQVTPAMLRLTDRTPSGAVTFTNPLDSAVTLWLAVDFPYVRQFNQLLFGSPDPPMQNIAGGMVEDALHNLVPDAEMWLGGFPRHLVLPPHAQRTVSLTVAPYPELLNGEYYARLRYVQSAQWQDSQTVLLPHGEVNVVYTKGPPLPPLYLTASSIIRAPSGAPQACVIVRQSGVGFVGTVRATVHDRAGHVVAVHAPGMTQPHPWAVTQGAFSVESPGDGRMNTADPVCVDLPSVTPGSYTVLLDVSRLDDPDHPAHVTIPWDGVSQ